MPLDNKSDEKEPKGTGRKEKRKKKADSNTESTLSDKIIYWN